MPGVPVGTSGAPAVGGGAGETDRDEDSSEAVAAVAAPMEEGGPTTFDEADESAFLAEARERGELSVPVLTSASEAEETDSKVLPSLDELVKRIPAEVRASLDDLFRARFVSVKRIPKRALKGP